MIRESTSKEIVSHFLKFLIGEKIQYLSFVKLQLFGSITVEVYVMRSEVDGEIGVNVFTRHGPINLLTKRRYR